MATLSLQRSRQLLREQGYATWIVEKPFNPYTKRREDLFNCIDLVGIRADMPGVIGIQACGEDCQGHIQKILEGFVDPKGGSHGPNPHLLIWLKAGNRFFIWAWRKRKHEGTKATWQLREVEFLLENGTIVRHENEVKV